MFPGIPTKGPSSEVPPPEALAFYLPFHYFHPTWWGIYIILERVHEFANALARYSRGVLTFNEALNVGKMFLYGHEAFHHITEALPTRLEVTHRAPIYTGGFERLFRRVYGTDDCFEEALASAHGYRKVKSKVFRNPNAPKNARRLYWRSNGTLGFVLLNTGELLSLYQNHPFTRLGPHLPSRITTRASLQFHGRGAAIWLSFPHAFSGISR